MNVHGAKAGGGFGILNHAELSAMIHNHCPPGVSLLHAGHLATFVQNHNGTPAAGGGTVRTYNGRQIFHHTCHGNAAGGAAIFFCMSAPGIASIVAVGRHTPVGVTTYNLHWRKSGWGSPQIDIA